MYVLYSYILKKNEKQVGSPGTTTTLGNVVARALKLNIQGYQ